MSEFDYWQRWGIDLDDADFASAWVALGIAAAARARRQVPMSTVTKALERSQKVQRELWWAFPQSPAATTRKASALALIDQTTPEDWARAWTGSVRALHLAAGDPSRPRLRIVSAPAEEPVLPWLRMLSEAVPAPRAVSFSILPARADCRMAWPLRLGFLPGNDAGELIARSRELWPTNEQTRSIALGREQANCDVLVHVGTTRELLRTLLDQPTGIKANAVVLRGGGAGDWGEVSSRLTAVVEEVRGSGYILIGDRWRDEDLPSAMNGFVEALSHAQTIDMAAAEAFGVHPSSSGRADLISAFTEEFVWFSLPMLAQTLNRRLKAMPSGSAIDLSPLGSKDAWDTRGVSVGGMQRGAAMPAAAAPDADRRVAAHSVAIKAELDFEHESDGAEVLATVADAIDSAKVPKRAQARRAARFLQQQPFVREGGTFRPASNGFVANVPAIVRVRIGPPEERWDSLESEFPVEKLPAHLESWTLTVWLSEPNHLPQPLKSRIRLPRDGESTECDFRFRPKAVDRFEGRVTVLHRGRVIQTAVLRGSVLSVADPAALGDAPTLHELVQVRRGLGDLGERRQFDLAFVLNHGAGGKQLSTGLSKNHAWISDLRQSIVVAEEINKWLAPVAKSVADYTEGLDSEKGRALLVQLAQSGSVLHLLLVKRQLGAHGNRSDIADKEYLQIVSTRSDAVIPFEFIYDYKAPADDAQLCEHWREGLQKGACRAECDRSSGERVCPMGFWGIRKVIERHALATDLAQQGRELFLQSEPTRASDTLHLGGIGVFGASERVQAATLAPLTATLNQRTGAAPEQATDWKGWVKLVHDKRPNLLVLLAHTDGNGTNVSLEIGGNTIKSIQIDHAHVRPDQEKQQPIVALLGCDTAGTANDYGLHVAVFKEHGAAIVIGTIATVFGDHAVQVAQKLIDGLLADGGVDPKRLGETLRTLKRQALLDNLLMPLCLVAYGDADWKLAK